jgi:uridylate kinase
LDAPSPRYSRVVLKLSGEMLAGALSLGICPEALRRIAAEVASVRALGVETAVVIGGGNFIRGLSAAEGGMDRVSADYMGMIATVLNCIAMQGALEAQGVQARLMTALEMKAVAEPFARRRALSHLGRGRVVLLAGGTGSPFFSTDSGAALRAAELGAGVVLKATKVNGVYDRDPMKHPDAVRFSDVTYQTVLERGLKVMDAAAISLCMESGIPIVVFNLDVQGNARRAVLGEPVGTVVHA